MTATATAPCSTAPQRLRRAPRAAGSWLLAGSLIAVVCFWGSRRVSTGPDAGTSLAGAAAAPAAGGSFRVCTFNIHGGKGTDGRLDLDRTAACLTHADVAALQEVHGAWFGGEADQAERLGHQLERPWLFAPTERQWWHESFGNGLLSRLPIVWWQRIPLPRRQAKSYRNVLLSVLEVGDRRVHVLATHVDRGSDADRREQLRTVGELFLALAPPAVLLGDLNTTARQEPLAELLARPGVTDALAELSAADQPRRIDWILVRGLRVVACGQEPTAASDHPPYWADLELEPTRPADARILPSRTGAMHASRRSHPHTSDLLE